MWEKSECGKNLTPFGVHSTAELKDFARMFFKILSLHDKSRDIASLIREMANITCNLPFTENHRIYRKINGECKPVIYGLLHAVYESRSCHKNMAVAVTILAIYTIAYSL